MSRYFGSQGSWAPYVSVAERRKQAEREIVRLRKEGHAIAPVIIAGRAIATTFWGKAWCENLESYRDFAYRLPRGRSYVRNRAVLDLQIAPHQVKALVSGASIYKVKISIAQTPQTQWKSICRDCAGGIDSLVELLRGRLSKGVMERLCRQDQGLFPRPSEIEFACSCPDFADMCKHVAAALYGVGARLDEEPELLFRLRAVDEKDLLANLDGAAPLSMTGSTRSRILEADDVSALFGLEMAKDDAPTAQSQGKVQTRPKPAHSTTSRPGHAAANKSPVRKRKPPVPKKRVAPPSAIKAASPAKPSEKRRKAFKPARASSPMSASAASGPKKPSSGGKP